MGTKKKNQITKKMTKKKNQMTKKTTVKVHLKVVNQMVKNQTVRSQKTTKKVKTTSQQFLVMTVNGPNVTNSKKLQVDLSNVAKICAVSHVPMGLIQWDHQKLNA